MNIKVVLIIFILKVSSSLQQLTTCGDSAVGSGFIVGGSTTKRGQWPFVAALFRTDNDEYFCGGTIITRRHVITAAHCLQPKYWDKVMQPSELVAFLGKYNISKRFEAGAVLSEVSEIKMHPDWNNEATNYDSDIAILITKEIIQTSAFIKVACWPPRDDASIGPGIVVGWGFSENTNYQTAESIAQQLKLSTVSNEYCFLHEPKLVSLSSNRTFCAGGERSGPCHGDSGGGFFIKVGTNWLLRGIVSASFFDNDGKCDVSKYAVYTNVVKHSNWVNEIVSKPFESRRLEYESIDPITGEKVPFYSYRSNNFHLNGVMTAASSISLPPIVYRNPNRTATS